MRPFKRGVIFFVCLFMLLLSAACSSNQSLTKIRVSEVTRSIFYTPLYVAIEKGFFEENGINLELKTGWGGDKTMTALLSDGADVALVGSETSIYVYKQGASEKIINFAQLTKNDGTFLVSREPKPDFTWDDLKDSTFLGQRKGGMPQMVGEFVLKKHGIDPHEDLNLIQNIDFANIVNAFMSGSGEYVQLFEPSASILEKEGAGFIIASFGEESGELPYTTFMAKEGFIKEEKTAKKFIKALLQAQEWVEENDSEEIAKVIQPYFDDTDVGMIATVVDRYRSQGSFATDMKLEKDNWEHLQEIMIEAGELNEKVPYEELVNTSLVEDVMKNK